MIDRLRAHYGFSRTPFGRDLAPGMPHRHRGHAEAVARITWLIGERAIGVITGEVGAGKTVATRAATTSLDPTRHTIVYLANPMIGERGLYAHIVHALGQIPRFHKANLVTQAAELLAAEAAERARTPILVIDEAHLLGAEQLEEIRMLTNYDLDTRAPFACLLLGQPTLRRRLKLGTMAALDQRIALRYHLDGMTLGGDRQLPAPPPATRRPQRPPVQRRRHRTHPPAQPWHPPRGQQPRPPGPGRRVRRRQGRGRRVRRPRRRHRGHRRLITTATPG
jgi:type II secretory pathway predicted ATPase ExeA